MTVRVIVCGSRRWHDREAVQERLSDLVMEHAPDYPVIVHGACPRGADLICEQEAGKAGLVTEPHPADWPQFGKRAGYISNEEMAKLGADLCLAFWDGKSDGTRLMIDIAKAYGIPVEVIRA